MFAKIPNALIDRGTKRAIVTFSHLARLGGTATVRDIRLATGWGRQQVQAALGELWELGYTERAPIRRRHTRGHPPWCYQAVEPHSEYTHVPAELLTLPPAVLVGVLRAARSADSCTRWARWGRLSVNLTKAAKRAGCSARTLSRALAQAEAAGVLVRHGREWVLASRIEEVRAHEEAVETRRVANGGHVTKRRHYSPEQPDKPATHCGGTIGGSTPGYVVHSENSSTQRRPAAAAAALADEQPQPPEPLRGRQGPTLDRLGLRRAAEGLMGDHPDQAERIGALALEVGDRPWTENPSGLLVTRVRAGDSPSPDTIHRWRDLALTEDELAARREARRRAQLEAQEAREAAEMARWREAEATYDLWLCPARCGAFPVPVGVGLEPSGPCAWCGAELVPDTDTNEEGPERPEDASRAEAYVITPTNRGEASERQEDAPAVSQRRQVWAMRHHPAEVAAWLDAGCPAPRAFLDGLGVPADPPDLFAEVREADEGPMREVQEATTEALGQMELLLPKEGAD